MKLYTEEQVKEILDRTYDIELGTYEQMKEYVLRGLTPIELPSNEEIENNAYTDRRVGDFEYHEQIGFERGALWLKEQILNQNK